MNFDRYKFWQQKLSNQKLFRLFWVTFGIYSVVAVFVISGILLLQGYFKVVFLAFLAFILGRLVLSPLVYLIYKKDRPYQKYNFHVLSSWLFSPMGERSNAFPSDHAISFAAISFIFFLHQPEVGIFLFLVTLLNGIGRIILGYHDQWDVLGGWAVGILSGLLIQLLISNRI